MELFLNILWMVIATAGLCVWRTRWVHQPRDRDHASWRQWTAFACALVPLFFMVSLTDDLHSDLVFFEESSAGRRHTTCVACPHHAPHNQTTRNAYADLAVATFFHAAAPIGPVAIESRSTQTALHAGLTCGRAPPVLLF
jgi:hypothetical protein